MSPPPERATKKTAEESPQSDSSTPASTAAPEAAAAPAPAAATSAAEPPRAPVPSAAAMPAPLAVWAERRQWPKWLTAALSVNRPVNQEFSAAEADALAQKTRALPLGRKGV